MEDEAEGKEGPTVMSVEKRSMARNCKGNHMNKMNTMNTMNIGTRRGSLTMMSRRYRKRKEEP